MEEAGGFKGDCGCADEKEEFLEVGVVFVEKEGAKVGGQVGN